MLQKITYIWLLATAVGLGCEESEKIDAADDDDDSSGDTDTGTDGDIDGGTDTGSDSTSETDTVDPCLADDLGNGLPVAVFGTTAGATDDFWSSCCGIQGGLDQAYSWTAPQAGLFRISTEGSLFDTVVYALDGICTGEELGCNDDVFDDCTSGFLLGLAQDEQITIVVDGYEPSSQGTFTLGVEHVVCQEDVDLGSALPHSEPGTTQGAGNYFLGSCGGGGGEDALFKWTAPADGSYTFDISNPSFNTILYVYDSACLTEIECNDSWGILESSLTVDLTQDTQVYIGVDGASDSEAGNFTLNIAAN